MKQFLLVMYGEPSKCSIFVGVTFNQLLSRTAFNRQENVVMFVRDDEKLILGSFIYSRKRIVDKEQSIWFA